MNAIEFRRRFSDFWEKFEKIFLKWMSISFEIYTFNKLFIICSWKIDSIEMQDINNNFNLIVRGSTKCNVSMPSQKKQVCIKCKDCNSTRMSFGTKEMIRIAFVFPATMRIASYLTITIVLKWGRLASVQMHGNYKQASAWFKVWKNSFELHHKEWKLEI